MTPRAKYRGVEFAVRARGASNWEWAYYQAGETVKGEVRGTRSEAVKAREKAIDAFLAKNPN
jgi:hypothetical protein